MSHDAVKPLCLQHSSDLDLQPDHSTYPWLINSKAPSILHQRSSLYLVCFSERPLFELREGQWCKDMNREHNAVCQNRNESRNACISGYDVSLSARCKRLHSRQSSIGSSVTGDRYRWNLHPWGAMRERDCVRDEELQVLQGGHKDPGSFHKHGSHLQQPSLESRTPGTAVSGDKWLLLNGVVPCCCASLVFSLSPNFISLNKVLLFATALSLSIRSLDKINRWYRQYVCVCAHQENESHFLTSNSGCGQQYKHLKQAIQSAMVQCRNTEAH